MIDYRSIVNVVKTGLINASTVLSDDKRQAYQNAFESETNDVAKTVLKMILENYEVAQKNHSPLCDDTGIPHLVLEAGTNTVITGELLGAVYEGVRQGLRELPGRSMAVCGDEVCRIEQTKGLSDDPADVSPAPIIIMPSDNGATKLHILMVGGGPAIRGKTYRIFHRHSIPVVINEIVAWASEAVAELGCTPCTLAIGIGRSHYEATAMMLMSQVEGKYLVQSEVEKEITARVNETHMGALGVGGNTTVLATFMKTGPQRASGVRIVCMRPCCCFEPRLATVELG